MKNEEPIGPYWVESKVEASGWERMSILGEHFLYELRAIDLAIVERLADDQTPAADMQRTWQERALLAEALIDSLEADAGDSSLRSQVQCDVMVDKAIIFEKAGNRVRYLEDIDAAEVFAHNSGLDEMAAPLSKELDEKIPKLGESPRELVLKLRGFVSFSNREYLRDLLADDLEYEDFIGDTYAMLLDEGNDPDDVFAQLGLT